MKHILYYIAIAFAIISFLTTSCTDDWTEELSPYPEYGNGDYEDGETPSISKDRETGNDTRKVLLLYSAGVNSLNSYLSSDIRDICSGWLPKSRRTDDVLLIYSHIATKGYNTRYNPTLTRVYTDNAGSIHKDTLMTYPEETISSSALQLNTVLTYIKDRFPAKSYGMIFSSHATGYLPSGYYNQASDDIFTLQSRRMSGLQPPVPVPYIEPEHDPSLPMVKSIGQDVFGSASYEMELAHFAKAIPMKMDYILFDACLMGGIEVAYELKEKCSRFGASQTEVLAEGFNYTMLTTHLLQNTTADPKSVCEDYFMQYDVQNGINRSATISLVDCDRLDQLADLCRELFERYRTGMDEIIPSNVQRYFRFNKHWFYDLESIMKEAGASETDMARLQEALDECIIYKGNTPSFMGAFDIKTFSGLSMYLPCNGSLFLDEHYKTLKWNEATGLVL